MYSYSLYERLLCATPLYLRVETVGTKLPLLVTYLLVTYVLLSVPVAYQLPYKSCARRFHFRFRSDQPTLLPVFLCDSFYTVTNLPPKPLLVIFTIMFRFAILVLFLPFLSVKSDNVIPCVEIFGIFEDCFSNSNVTIESPNSDDATANCIACLTNNNFFDATTSSCDATTNQVCEFLNICQDDCLPTVNVCQKEYNAYNECFFGGVIAPDGCLVQCDGSTSDGDSSATGESIGNGGSNANGGANNTGSSSSSSMNIMTLTESTIFLALVMVGSGLLGSRF